MNAKIAPLQWLRALASILVVFAHAQGHVAGMAEKYALPGMGHFAESLFQLGLCGVDIFFVISGFIMALITAGHHRQPGAIRHFAQKRLLRIVPPYWLWTLLMAALLLFLPQLFSVRHFNLFETLLSCLFIPFTPEAQNTSPVLAVGWTLSYEMYFYALVCLGLLVARWAFLLGLGLFFITTTVFLPPQGPVWALMSSTLLWEFYAGVLLYEAHGRIQKVPPCRALLVALVMLGLFYAFREMHGTTWRFVFWGLPALLLTGTLVHMRAVRETWLTRLGVFLGDSSYTLYLSHLITLPAVAKVFVVLGLHTLLPPVVQVVVYTTLCTLLGALLYVTTEKTLLTFFSKKFSTPPATRGC